MSKLCVLYWDQLSESGAALRKIKKGDFVLLAEVKELTENVPHHKKKLIFLFSAMRHFAQSLEKNGYKVIYTKFDDKDNSHTVAGEIDKVIEKNNGIDEIFITEPSEYDLLTTLEKWQKKCKTPVNILQDDRFLASKKEFKKWADGRKELLMEYFYRDMRKKTGLLMEGDKPVGGEWNFDKSNRKPLKKAITIPAPKQFKPDKITDEVTALVEKEFKKNFGESKGFYYATTKDQAQKALDHFCLNALPYFGDYQDAMAEKEPFLFHSIISPYINAGLLDPLKVCQQVEKEYRNKRIPINAAEGFIRQIIGWREYIRGVYWLKMPDYRKANFLKTQQKLPEFYWSAKTDMKCLSEVIGMTKQEAYSHHIQRLMVTGNFALLAGIDAHKVHEWYLTVYIDAFEWVEIPNTIGMSLFADGGVVGTKPYIASGAYINRMSNFCKSCKYNVKEKLTDDACPYNFLYWNFLDRHEDKFKNNHRMGLAYKNLNRLSSDDRKKINTNAEKFLKDLS